MMLTFLMHKSAQKTLLKHFNNILDPNETAFIEGSICGSRSIVDRISNLKDIVHLFQEYINLYIYSLYKTRCFNKNIEMLIK